MNNSALKLDTHTLEIVIRCQFDGTLEEARDKLAEDFDAFEYGDNISDDYMAESSQITQSRDKIKSWDLKQLRGEM